MMAASTIENPSRNLPLEPQPKPSGPVSLQRRLSGLGVHLFTASGVLWGFLALVAMAENKPAEMFAWLAVALFVDGIDGTIARQINITEAAPRFSGAALDLVVDFLTYVIVPAFALYSLDLLSPGWNVAAAAIIVLTSAMYFADNEMKTEDAWFKGFPAVWNLVVFYFFLLEPSAVTAFVVVAVLGAMTFAPFVFVHPLRVEKLRYVTLTLLVAWSVLAIYAIWQKLDPGVWVTRALCLTGLYFVVLGYFRAPPPMPEK